MQIQFATKKVDGAYETALFVDGVFKRSAVGADVLALLVKMVGPILRAREDEGTEFGVQIGILTGTEAAREEARLERARQKRDADAEATEIEALTASVKREQTAREAALGSAQIPLATQRQSNVELIAAMRHEGRSA